MISGTLFIILMLLASGAMLKLSERLLVLCLGGACLLVLIPTGIFIAESQSWREHVLNNTTTVGPVLISLVAIGSIGALVCALSAVLRFLIVASRALFNRKTKLA
jgi:predicted tellurium resistance membrane protein TerC